MNERQKANMKTKKVREQERREGANGTRKKKHAPDTMTS